MRRALTIVLLLTAAACTSKRATTPAVTYRPVVEAPTEHGDLIGLGIDDVAKRLGQPDLQVREGTSVKFQYRGRNCVLDAYFYRANSGEGALRVTHVDARDKDGRDTSQQACLAEIQAS